MKRLLLNKSLQIQKIVLTSTAHVLRKTLSIKATAKKIAQNENQKTTKQQQQKHPFWLPQVSGREPAVETMCFYTIKIHFNSIHQRISRNAIFFKKRPKY